VDATFGGAPRLEGPAGPRDLAIGGEVARDADLLRCEPGLFGPVASAPTISRTLTTLAQDAPAVIEAISQARRIARDRAWALAGDRSPAAQAGAKNPLVIDLDATLINVHSEKEQAAPTFKRGFGFHPLCAFVDHGQSGRGPSLSPCPRATRDRTPPAITSLSLARPSPSSQ